MTGKDDDQELFAFIESDVPTEALRVRRAGHLDPARNPHARSALS